MKILFVPTSLNFSIRKLITIEISIFAIVILVSRKEFCNFLKYKFKVAYYHFQKIVINDSFQSRVESELKFKL